MLAVYAHNYSLSTETDSAGGIIALLFVGLCTVVLFTALYREATGKWWWKDR